MSYSIDELLKVSNNDIVFVKKILNMFITEIDEKVELLKNALSEKKYIEIATITHQFKSNFQLFDQQGLVKLSKEIESYAKSVNKNEICESKTIVLIELIQELKHQIKKDLDNGKY